MFLKNGYQCPGYSLWSTTIDKEQGREVVLNALLSDDRRMKKFASAMVRRAKQAHDKMSSHTVAAAVVQYFDALLEVLSIFIPHSGHLRRRLVQVDYITEYSRTLSEMATKISDSELKGACRPIITTVAKLAKLVYEQQDRVLRNWRDLIAGDFLSLITRITMVIPVHDDEYQNYAAYAMLHNLGAHTVYPMILRALPSVEAIQMLIKKVERVLGIRNPTLTKEWKIFCSGVIGRATIMQLNTFTQCDNSICKRFHLRVDTKAPRQCTRCSSVVYCSDECQREDWNRWHRTECFPAIAVHYDRRSTDRWYTHADRWYQTNHLEPSPPCHQRLLNHYPSRDGRYP
ncbi:hypothetical protein FA13DRAFT_359998 [Coprinellus micaceus]|uniref:MYND-type domain-containing protein n=1 Tax=Coprinellus micaceus TaxID=71717 RepID=A0A4Y7TAX2_COPMI|nr:hypothetical protein FA13DRAFT_359998 [Coprinellus micaceus]